MHALWWVNPFIVAAYMAGLLGAGLYFSKAQTSAEAYFVANRSVPGWAMGISLLATIITSVTFIAYPGAAYEDNWSLILPGVMMLAVPLFTGILIVPFFRQAVRMTAFEYFGQRFGSGVRLYSSAMFALGHLSKMGFVLYLLALTVNSMTGWSLGATLFATTFIAVGYALVGGLQAVIWADVFQGLLLWVAVLLAAGFLIHLIPLPLSEIFSVALHAGKFSLGSLSLNPHQPTVAVLLLYGLSFYVQKYTADQTVVQRYLAARSDRQAFGGILLGAVLCLPVWGLFMLIGTLLWAFYRARHEPLPPFVAERSAEVFPYFLTTHLPAGVGGILLAALFGAALAMLASDLNCLAAIAVEDFYCHWRPVSSDKTRLRIGRGSVLAGGILAVTLAWQLTHLRGTVLALYYAVGSIVAGGLAGIFLLAFLCARATPRGVQIGIAFNIVFTVWATLTAGANPVLKLKSMRFTWSEYLIGVIGQMIVLLVGYVASWLPPQSTRNTELTLWAWLASKRPWKPNRSGARCDYCGSETPGNILTVEPNR